MAELRPATANDHHLGIRLFQIARQVPARAVITGADEAGRDAVAGRNATSAKQRRRRDEAADASRCESELWHDKDYPKIQILTIEGLLNNAERVDAPPQMNPFAKAQCEAKPEEQ